ncbi:putative nb-arc and ankyrin domain protein [Botrytis fragariae]|uniref:Putative nb-arc and ankyrin domain protein n=1 Tax=Botrytis fragariae TaxID=1964551 RepID=A0A8H6AWF0_9HELO|nr:putative nb-arc and ankyrin domain protein [Botrytis fragariae]KAF5874813.1 putative nb-arc and ankyrin domain protein [Botrytis fragariae]
MHLLEYNSEGQFGLAQIFAGSDIPKYAILSHTWGADTDELTFQDLLNDTGQDKSGYQKLQFCGEQAKRDGLQYFWVDTCCIDKSSSAELQEAINSMFRWYQNATKCYVYLSDVSTNGHNQASSSWQSIFKASRWFTRGWTLQELIAPRSVEFFCSSRMLLGDKRSLQHLIHEITGIEISALHGQNLSDFTIDERMSWAKNRQTKREEDMAYCLLGIFDVHMPLIYGERSESAFRRLTEEIGKRPKKHTLDDSPVFSAADSRSGKRSKTSQYESSNHLSRLQTVGGSETLCQYPTHDIDATTRQSIVEQLYFPKIDERLTSLTAAQGKTCRWFLTKSEYLSWNDVSKRQDHEGFLWIKGNPGTGKSTLMKLLFEEAKLKTKGDSSKITLSFFFLARGTIEERTTTGLYRSLLHQLFEKMIELRDSLEWMTADGARGIERNGWSEAALKQTLKHAVAKLGSRPLMIFVDALDECDQKQASGMVSFFEELCELAEVSQVSLQICFSSRHYPTIVIQKGMELTLEDELGHMEDIQHYIKSKLRLGKSKQAKALRSEILQKSSSIFLWVVLVLDILNSEYTAGSISIKKISKRLNEIPPGLNDLFEMILKRDGENLEELQLCLKLILFATRPLKPQELYFATQIGLDEDCMGSWDQEDVNVDQMRLFVRSSSKGLAEVTKNKASDVQFIHESVRDFLLGRYETQLSGVSGNFVGHGHDTLKNCCLAQLNAVINQKIMIHFNFSRSNFWECRNMKYPFSNTLKPDEPVPHDQRSKETQSKLQEEIRLKFPFLDYSVSNILYHANLAQQNYIEQVDFLAKFPTHLWVFVNNYLENHEIRRYTDSVTILYLLAERNLANLIRKRPRKESCFDVTEQRYGPSILAALATGSDEAAQTLLKIEAETFPSNSLQHDLCKTYHPKNLKNFKLGRSFTYTQKSDLIFQLSRCNQEIPLVFKLSSDESWFGPNLNDRGKTLLIEAVERDQCIVATYLLEKGIDANCIKEVGEVSLLGKAVISGHANMVKVLLEKGAEVNYRGFDNNTPLTFAVHRKHGEIAKLLLEEGAEVNIKTGSDNTPLMEASLAGSLDIVKLLLKKGAKTDYRGYNNRTPLMNAAFYGRKNVVDLLLENDAEVNCVDFGNESPLMKAAATGHVNIMSLLLEKGAKFDCKEEGFALALLSNSRYGRKEMVEFLLQSGVDASPRDMMPGYQGWTPLIHAASNGNENIVKLLLENGAEINAKSESGCTPLYEAASWGHGHEAVVAILLKQSASTEVENKDNNGLLLKAVKIAISEGKLSILKLLLEKTPNINQKGAMGQTPLFWAISSLNEDMVKLLLDKGASIESRSDGGLSPLMHAILIGGHLRIVKTLLDRGADINAEDYEGSTPPSMIKKNSTLTYPLEAYVPELKIGY